MTCVCSERFLYQDMYVPQLHLSVTAVLYFRSYKGPALARVRVDVLPLTGAAKWGDRSERIGV